MTHGTDLGIMTAGIMTLGTITDGDTMALIGTGLHIVRTTGQPHHPHLVITLTDGHMGILVVHKVVTQAVAGAEAIQAEEVTQAEEEAILEAEATLEPVETIPVAIQQAPHVPAVRHGL